MHIEGLSIKRTRVLGAFPAVLDDLNFKFSGEACSRTPLVCSYFTIQFSQKKGYKQDRQTNYQSIHSYITSPYWWESKRASKGCGKWKNREVRIDLAKNIMATSLKVRCKTLCRPNAVVCNATIWCAQKAFSKKVRVCTCHTLHSGPSIQTLLRE